ncbi:hypothetical protein SAMN05216455_10757 [Segatella bryantii]|nr:hypothetical protein SAMN05216455_10757 [Segatella bryantii]
MDSDENKWRVKSVKKYLTEKHKKRWIAIRFENNNINIIWLPAIVCLLTMQK